MARARKRDAGFDVEAAIVALHEAALAAGALARDAPGARHPLMTAMVHLHGLGIDVCTQKPCRVGGLCFALYEVASYQAESGAGPRGCVVRAAEETERFRTAVRRVAKPYLRAFLDLCVVAREQHEMEARAGWTTPRHAHDALCVAPRQVASRAIALVQELDRAPSLREILDSPELRQTRSGSGKRSKLLLTAVYQHLDWGGLTCSEIARLVPDGYGDRDATEAAERVRKRVALPDVRSLSPFDGDATDDPERTTGRDTSG